MKETKNISASVLLQMVCLCHLLVEKRVLTKGDAKQILSTGNLTAVMIDRRVLKEHEIKRSYLHYGELVTLMKEYYSKSDTRDRMNVLDKVKKLLDGEKDDKKE